MKEIVLNEVVGGAGEDNDMTASNDIGYMITKLSRLAKEKGLKGPFRFVILPKKWIIEKYPYHMWKMSKMLLIDKNDKVIETHELVWK